MQYAKPIENEAGKLSMTVWHRRQGTTKHTSIGSLLYSGLAICGSCARRGPSTRSLSGRSDPRIRSTGLGSSSTSYPSTRRATQEQPWRTGSWRACGITLPSCASTDRPWGNSRTKESRWRHCSSTVPTAWIIGCSGSIFMVARLGLRAVVAVSSCPLAGVGVSY